MFNLLAKPFKKMYNSIKGIIIKIEYIFDYCSGEIWHKNRENTPLNPVRDIKIWFYPFYMIVLIIQVPVLFINWTWRKY